MADSLDLAELVRLLAAAPKGLAIKSADVRRKGLTVHFTHDEVRSANDAAFEVVHAACACLPGLIAEANALRVALRRTGMCGACIDTNHIALAQGCCPCDCGDGWVVLDAALKEAGL